MSLTQAQEALARIDVHCHVFNASDLSVGGFVRRVVFEDYTDQVPLTSLRPPSFVSALIATLVRFLTTDVITAKDELSGIRSGAASLAAPFDPYSPAAQDALAKALGEVLGQPAAGPPQSDVSLRGIELTQAEIELFADGIRRELRQTPATSKALIADSDFKSMAAGLFGSFGMIGRNVRWAAWLRGPRLDNVKRLIDLYENDGVRLFTPALVDFARWLDEDPRSGFASQVLLMEEIQKIAAGNNGGLVHCFAPYDPWQQIVDEADGKTETSFSIARDAVDNRGFVGVKLYPPMGFLPSDNETGGLTYPPGHTQIAGFGTKLDAALEKLYAWAEQDQVPVMAHATNSNGAGPDYAQRAHPNHWIKVLTRHPALRLNLAHFGGFDERSEPLNWETTIGQNLQAFPNLYADLAFLSEALPATDAATRLHVAASIEKFARKYDTDKRRLLYGSDWIMLGRESDHGRYFSEVQNLMAQAGFGPADWKHITRDNAIAFLGLSSGSATRMRLEGWYQRTKLDPTSLVTNDLLGDKQHQQSRC